VTKCQDILTSRVCWECKQKEGDNFRQVVECWWGSSTILSSVTIIYTFIYMGWWWGGKC